MSPMVEDIGGSEAGMDDIVVWGKKHPKNTHDMRMHCDHLSSDCDEEP